jgi:hypothetical protein
VLLLLPRASGLHRFRCGAALAGALASASCATGPSAPPGLAYRVPESPAVSYAAGDTLVVAINALGQTLDLTVNGTARYDVDFTPADDGVRVTLAVRNLSAEVTLPMAGPLRVDEDILQGDLVFDLTRRGDVTVVATPVVEATATPFFAGPTIAHSFFPGLPGVAVQPGDSWVDTVSFSEGGDAGDSSQTSVTTYRVVGEAVVDGRPLLEIAFEGTQEMAQTMALQGTEIRQETQLAVRGRVLWDVQRGVMFERETVSTGTGTVRVAVAPEPLPTRVEVRSHARLEAR